MGSALKMNHICQDELSLVAKTVADVAEAKEYNLIVSPLFAKTQYLISKTLYWWQASLHPLIELRLRISRLVRASEVNFWCIGDAQLL